MKFIFTVLSGIIIGIAVFYFSQDWKEERLVFTLAEPAIFGDTSFQNLEILNDGFDPATNVKLYVSAKLGPRNPQFVSKFDLTGDGQSFVGGFERIRRGERVIVSLTTKLQPLTRGDVTIKSDRSVASYATTGEWSFDRKSFWLGFGTFLGFIVLLGIAIPAYQDYKKRALRALMVKQPKETSSQNK